MFTLDHSGKNLTCINVYVFELSRAKKKITILQFTFVYFSLKISMSVSARQAHASEGSSASILLVPTCARGTLLTVVEDTTSMKRAHAVLVWLKKHKPHYQYR